MWGTVMQGMKYSWYRAQNAFLFAALFPIATAMRVYDRIVDTRRSDVDVERFINNV